MMLSCLSFNVGQYMGVSFDLFISHVVESTRHLDISVDRVLFRLFMLLTLGGKWSTLRGQAVKRTNT